MVRQICKKKFNDTTIAHYRYKCDVLQENLVSIPNDNLHD